MKTRVLSLVIIMLMAITSVMAQDKDDSEFLVAGACGMCKTRIEKAAKTVEGVSEATWDKETMMLALTYSNDNVDVKEVHKLMAKVGHDTKLFKAEDEVYDKLPGCCKYERLKDEK